MTDLSPAAQAVYDAVLATYHESVPRDDSLWALERASTVAALRAAVEQPYEVPLNYMGNEYWAFRHGVEAERSRNLAIAAELEDAS